MNFWGLTPTNGEVDGEVEVKHAKSSGFKLYTPAFQVPTSLTLRYQPPTSLLNLLIQSALLVVIPFSQAWPVVEANDIFSGNL